MTAKVILADLTPRFWRSEW